MIKPRISKLRQSLQATHAEMGQLLPAYLSYRPRTCGNPGCRCAKGQRHPAWIVQFTAGGRSHCRSVSKAKYEALAIPAQAYRRFCSARARSNRAA